MAYPQETFSNTTFLPGSFWAFRRKAVRKNTLAYQLRVLKATGRYDAFRLKWHPIYGEDVTPHWPVAKHQFWDSDVAKWIEGACYFLAEEQDEEIDAAVKELVDMIRGAQQEDGYINIHYTVVEPEKRFTNVTHLHELYNAGHLLEAALAHHLCYKNTLLLDPLIKYVRLLHNTFGPGPNQIHGYPGHPEIELALFRLHDLTKDPAPYELATYFITERGSPTSVHGKHFYDAEAEARGEPLMMRPDSWPMKRSYWYGMAHKPLLEQETIEGHSVRAMYLLTAVADYVRLGDTSKLTEYKATVERLWSNMIEKKMYVTGGIGAIPQWEGFGIDYFLPQGMDEGGCYAETCASIGVMMLAERLLQLDLDGAYADYMELCLYNAVLSGMGSNGTSFTYTNHLASSDADPSKREEWFECACCPPNVTRTMGILGGYFWTSGVEDETTFINVHLYNSATLEFSSPAGPVSLTQKTIYPWEGNIAFQFSAPKSLDIEIRLRIPSWSGGFTLDPPLEALIPTKGYITLPSNYLSTNPTFTLTLRNLNPRLLTSHPLTNQTTLTLARGPLIYCIEDVDNPWVTDHFSNTFLSPASPTPETYLEEMCLDLVLGAQYLGLVGKGVGRQFRVREGKGVFRQEGEKGEGVKRDLWFVPYFLRANRGGKGQMRVGLKKLV